MESDISDEKAVRKIYSAVVQRYGRIDILINNAAVDDENGFDIIEKIPQIDDDLEKAVIPLIPMEKLIQPEDIIELKLCQIQRSSFFLRSGNTYINIIVEGSLTYFGQRVTWDLNSVQI